MEKGIIGQGIDVSSLPDTELIKHIKENSPIANESILALQSRHSGIYTQIYSKYQNTTGSASVVAPEDDRLFVIYKAALLFDKSRRTKFSSWLGAYTRYHCLNQLPDKEDPLVILSDKITDLDRPPTTEPAEELFNEELREEMFNILNSMEDQRAAEVFRLRFYNEPPLTWREIGAKLGVTYQCALNLFNKNKLFVKTKLTKAIF